MAFGVGHRGTVCDVPYSAHALVPHGDRSCAAFAGNEKIARADASLDQLRTGSRRPGSD
jgi:hypothetical protein